MKFQTNKYSKILAAAILILSIAISIFASGGVLNVHASAPAYTDVMTDLYKDGKFTVEDYPAKSGDNTLEVIQIAESTDGELLIYVYQPAALERELTATTVRLSQSIGDNLSPKDYKLTLLSSQGVFQKYRVEGVDVLADAVRYYEIIAIHRKWDSAIDEGTGNVNINDEVVYEVGKRWTACTLNGEVTYGCTYEETITVTDKYCGYVRYYNGFKFFPDSCDAHYVAFSTDRQIDRLIEAEVSYLAMPYAYGMPFYEAPVPFTVELSEMDEASTKADGLFATKYTWNRIESVADFKAGESLNDDALSALSNKQWVLRFCETSYTERVSTTGIQERTKTVITEVTILRLKFETDGVTYNLGVVDNKQSEAPDQSPDNVPPPDAGEDMTFWQWLYNELFVKRTWWVWLCTVAVFLTAMSVLTKVLSLFIPVFVPLWNVIWAVITAPFRFIAWLIHKIRGGD